MQRGSEDVIAQWMDAEQRLVAGGVSLNQPSLLPLPTNPPLSLPTTTPWPQCTPPLTLMDGVCKCVNGQNGATCDTSSGCTSPQSCDAATCTCTCTGGEPPVTLHAPQ